MRLARIGKKGNEKPVIVTEGGYLDLSAITHDIDGNFLENGLKLASEAFDSGDLPMVHTEEARFGPPIVRPMAIVCVGMNYAAHAAESNAEPPEVPIIFFKHPNTLAGPTDPIQIPRASKHTDWEVELGIVIGKKTSYLASREAAEEHIAGYVLANDVSERAFQLEESGGQWSKGKCCPGFTPVGPYLVTPDEVDPQNLPLRSWVNGQTRQNSNTSDMIFDPLYIIYHLSQYMALEPGDLVLTGTPEGVAISGRFPYLAEGDIVEMEIPILGRMRQHVVGAI